MTPIKVKFLFKNLELKNWYSVFFLNLISNHFEIQIDEENPDFIFHDAHVMDVVKYSGVRIGFAGENARIDFNISDYGIGFDHLFFQDRYLRFPLYLLYTEALNAAEKKSESILFESSDKLINRKFCNFLVSNGNGIQFRTQFFKYVNEYKQVDSGGKYLNTIGHLISNKFEWQKGFKFSLCFENSSTSGYLTEKLIEASAAGTIPIYWGDPDALGSIESGKGGINPKAIISVDSKQPQMALEKIQELDNTPDLYMKTLKEPLFLDDNHSTRFNKELEIFLFSIFEQKKSEAYRRGFGQVRLNIEARNTTKVSFLPTLKRFLNKT